MLFATTGNSPLGNIADDDRPFVEARCVEVGSESKSGEHQCQNVDVTVNFDAHCQSILEICQKTLDLHVEKLAEKLEQRAVHSERYCDAVVRESRQLKSEFDAVHEKIEALAADYARHKKLING